MRGNGLVRHFGESYDNLVLVAGFSKAYSSLLAFLACPTEIKDIKVPRRRTSFPAPSPVASPRPRWPASRSTTARRPASPATWPVRTPHACSKNLARLGVHTPNRSGFPVIEVPLARHELIGDVGRFPFDRGIDVTLAAYPLVPRSEVGFRVQVTAANTDAEIEHLNRTLAELADRFPLQQAGERAA